YVLAGSAGGFFKQNEFLKLPPGGPNHNRLLATIASAVGVQGPDGAALEAFGDARLPRGVLRDVMAGS
ncbi:MAG: transcriptional initiation protein Tat, partial [Polyangiaceae bacterium]